MRAVRPCGVVELRARFDPPSALVYLSARGILTRRDWGWLRRCGLACSLLGACSALGCASSDEATPSEMCERYVSSFCDKAVSCARETDRGDFSELCDFAFRVYLPCEQVTRVWRDSQACQNQISAIRCEDVEPGTIPQTPSDCQGLFGAQ